MTDVVYRLNQIAWMTRGGGYVPPGVEEDVEAGIAEIVRLRCEVDEQRERLRVSASADLLRLAASRLNAGAAVLCASREDTRDAELIAGMEAAAVRLNAAADGRP